MTPLFGTAVQDYYLDLVRKNFTARKARLEALRTKEDAERYVAGVRAKIAKLFPFPAEKTPESARIRAFFRRKRVASLPRRASRRYFVSKYFMGATILPL